jgi:wyosine [tRNA(Phe)-imidazoG37] synthetase (radical SAM superfamily)
VIEVKLSVRDHDRDALGMKYVYPVVSRRARGLSIGINLNTNNACNFRCVYCQVPGLVAGSAPPVDVQRLRAELARLLDDVCAGDFLQRCVPEPFRRLNDVALSGNGEPTSSRWLGDVIRIVADELARRSLGARVKIILITNGSLMLQARVTAAVRTLGERGGEVWFKLDSATTEGIARVNGSKIGPAGQLARLIRCAELCPTYLQTCMFAWDGKPPGTAEQEAYLARVAELVRREIPIQGVLLYGLARPSHQPEADRLSALPAEWLNSFAARIRTAGLPVQVSV